MRTSRALRVTRRHPALRAQKLPASVILRRWNRRPRVRRSVDDRDPVGDLDVHAPAAPLAPPSASRHGTQQPSAPPTPAPQRPTTHIATLVPDAHHGLPRQNRLPIGRYHTWRRHHRPPDETQTFPFDAAGKLPDMKPCLQYHRGLVDPALPPDVSRTQGNLKSLRPGEQQACTIAATVPHTHGPGISWHQ